MKRLCSICARGGSKGVEGKNLKKILSKPLIAYSIEQALESKLFDVISVSSDSEDILKVSKQYGANVIIKRPDELATDTAPKLPVIRHCATATEAQVGYQFDTFIDLDCTSPLRSIEDIQNVVKIVENDNCSNVITGMAARRSPYFNLVELNKDGFVSLSKKLPSNITRRQDSPPCYDMNASIYGWKRDQFFSLQSTIAENTKIYVMPEERSIDIDSELDLMMVTFLLEKRNGIK